MPPTHAALDEEEVDDGECYARTSGIRWSNHELGTVDPTEEPAFWMRFEPQEVDEFVDSGMHGCGSDDAGLTSALSDAPLRDGGRHFIHFASAKPTRGQIAAV